MRRALREAGKALLIVAMSGGMLLLGFVLTGNVCNDGPDDRARMDLKNLSAALRLHHRKTGRYPTSAEGLQALVDSGVLEQLPLDPWRNEYGYAHCARHIFLWSQGADGEPGGEGRDADLVLIAAQPPAR